MNERMKSSGNRCRSFTLIQSGFVFDIRRKPKTLWIFKLLASALFRIPALRSMQESSSESVRKSGYHLKIYELNRNPFWRGSQTKEISGSSEMCSCVIVRAPISLILHGNLVWYDYFQFYKKFLGWAPSYPACQPIFYKNSCNSCKFEHAPNTWFFEKWAPAIFIKLLEKLLRT